MTETSAKRRPAGAAMLQESVTAAISDALLAELAESGYARTSMDAVARRAGVGKAALYRRWSSKEAMVIDLIGEAVRATVLPVPDTGTLHGDLTELLQGLNRQLAHPLVTAIGPSLLAEAAHDTELGDALRAAVEQPRRSAAATLLHNAVERGELPTNLHLDVALDLIAGPLSMRRLILGPPDENYLPALLSAITAALPAARTPGTATNPARHKPRG